ncbi:allatostatin-A receptor-like [Ptychodera flava]|uniref:allatostatin-A receptor-like n=1 Tax=Ptychodera flava TaxID=63121 RepID=UPI003969C189
MPPYVYNTELTMGVIGTIGNFLVVLVVWLTPSMRTTTNFLIVNLAAADLLTSALMIANKYPTNAFDLHVPEGLAGELFCRLYYNGDFFWISIRESTFGLLLVTLERYLALVHPFLYGIYCTNSRVAIAVVISWTFAAFIQMGILSFHHAEGGHCILFDYPNVSVSIFFGTFYFVVCYLVPTVVMVWAYARIFISLKVASHNGPGAIDDRISSLVRARKRLVKMLILVLLAFFLCWTPANLIFMIHNLGGPIDYFSGYYNAIALLAYANSILNPFIYAFKYKQFRNGFLASLPRFLFKKNSVDAVNTASVTLTTVAASTVNQRSQHPEA